MTPSAGSSVPHVRRGRRAGLAWLGVVVLSVPAIIFEQVVPGDVAPALVYDVVGVLALLAMVVGIIVHRPARFAGWWLMAGGLALWVVGDFTWDVLTFVIDTAPTPSIADVIYLSAYPVLAVGLGLVARARSRTGDLAATAGVLLDAAIVTCGLAVVGWLLFVDPILADTSLDPLLLTVTVAYPLGDVLLVGVIAVLLASPGVRTTSYWLLAIGVVVTLVGDFLYLGQELVGLDLGRFPDVFWLIGYAMLAAATLHPSMADVAADPEGETPMLRNRRLALLLVASLLAPALLLVQWIRGVDIDVPAIAVGTTVGFGLVLARMSVLVNRLRDVADERGDLADRLREIAFHDQLTGLANRALFLDRVAHALHQRRGPDQVVSVLLLDLDDFKTVNDSAGHSEGDRLLAAVSDRVRRCLREGDTAARLGGDEFGILLEDLGDAGRAVSTAERILHAFEEPFALGNREVNVGASIGIAFPTATVDTADSAVRDADVAMYLAKARGKGRIEVFEPSMHETMIRRLHIQAALRGCVERDELRVEYQPIVNLADGRIASVEALVRWDRPGHGLLMPSEFLDVAESTGLIVPIGRRVIETALDRLVGWRSLGIMTTLHVNVSTRELLERGFADWVSEAVGERGLDPASVTFEITEAAVVEERTAAVDAVSAIGRLGVRLAMDDFGSGYSSLRGLRRLPLHILKIDRSFLVSTSSGLRDVAVVRAIVQLAHTLGLEPVAQGVETAEQVARLREAGCRFGQGTFLAAPLDASAAEKLLLRGKIARAGSARARPPEAAGPLVAGSDASA